METKQDASTLDGLENQDPGQPQSNPAAVSEDKVSPRRVSVPGLIETRTDLPELRTGDEIKVFYRVIEGGKERIQVYEGTIIAFSGSGITKNITVRKTSFGIAVERIFPLNSPLVQKIEIKRHTKVRRAKLYYLRKLKGKAARLKELR